MIDLSGKKPNIFRGKEIKEWIRYNCTHETEDSVFAEKAQHYLHLCEDNREYIVLYLKHESDRRMYILAAPPREILNDTGRFSKERSETLDAEAD